MVHIKCLELTNFKSFGGTTTIPLLPGFTVVSGPNGSGKSNILDALLFCLGLSTSKGMRAERLPDLVNNKLAGRKTVETIVTVTFDLEDLSSQKNGQNELGSVQPQVPEVEENGYKTRETKDPFEITNSFDSLLEWSISRRLRVTKQGTYTSTYYMNGQPCTLSQLHEQLNQLRVYAEGYNVVLQGDVTGIISMKSRERREIIDELAGVAQFDRKISLAKEKLDLVKEQEEKSRIVERELEKQCGRLSQDCVKAKKYQQLRGELEEKSLWQTILRWQNLQKQEWKLRENIESGDRSVTEFNQNIQAKETEVRQAQTELDDLNAQVKALGEEQLLALQSSLATQEAERCQFQKKHKELEATIKQTQKNLSQLEQEVNKHQQNLEVLATEIVVQTQNVSFLEAGRNEAQEILNQQRGSASAIADTAEAWVKEQGQLHHQIESLQQTLNPQRTEQARVRERAYQLEKQIQEQQESLGVLGEEIEGYGKHYEQVKESKETARYQVESLTKQLEAVEQDLKVQQDTQTRLLQEQRDRQRKLDKLEAQQQAIQEATGTYATKMLQQSGISGICGLVAQLGRVEPKYQLALEVAAGGRLGNMVVENDGVAALGIEFLKRHKAGRMTFLPLNKIRYPAQKRDGSLGWGAAGFIDYAVNLIECDPHYQDIFAYVFGSTLVFDILVNARKYLGKYRIVTLDGEILESSGAMTGGSMSRRSGSLHFGTVDGRDLTEIGEMESHSQRLQEIDIVLERCLVEIEGLKEKVKERSQAFMEGKQYFRETELKVSQIEAELQRLIRQQEQGQGQLEKNNQELVDAHNRLMSLDQEIPDQEVQLTELRKTLAELEKSHTHSEWQQLQTMIRSQEVVLQEQEATLRSAEQKLQHLENQQRLLQEKVEAISRRCSEYQEQELDAYNTIKEVKSQILVVDEEVGKTREGMAKVEERLGTEKQKRDEAEANLRELYLAKQGLEWQLQKLQESQQGRREQLVPLQILLEEQKAELPDPLPIVPEKIKMTELEKEVRSLQKQLQALEPVNMLALEEYEQTQKRLEELSQKLGTLEEERTALLLRIENFTTMRQRSFFEAFNAVNKNFQTIFAALSEGDGYLQLDNQEDPFNSGLNLVAHPKGKPVQRLASMSGGEKSLTALSFIFALQRYRPSPFYAFDEVDMFLDGANVERLAKMIKQQAEGAQFIVVSLRRPMMELSERTIGVTQARGAYTQVLGIKMSQH
ncbi:MAG: chromosome segregation protein SMC [Trichodesmium sp. ALOHA_ZT_67]|nr:chromosome segregation protein SMC [Trichodesmium sp. ALOHA_ZT_67]